MRSVPPKRALLLATSSKLSVAKGMDRFRAGGSVQEDAFESVAPCCRFQAAVLPNPGDKSVEHGSPFDVARFAGMGVGERIERLGGRHQCGPFRAFDQCATVGVIGHEDVHAARNELAFARLWQVDGDETCMLEALPHDGLHERSSLHAYLHAGLVDVTPLPHDAAGACGYGIDIALQIGRGELELLHALRQLDAQIRRQCRSQIDVQAAELAGARVPKRDALVRGPDTDPDFTPGLNAVLNLTCCGAPGGQSGSQEPEHRSLHSVCTEDHGASCLRLIRSAKVMRPTVTCSRKAEMAALLRRKQSTISGSKALPRSARSISSAFSWLKAGR